MSILTEAVARTHSAGILHSEFWKFIGYATATFVIIRQAFLSPSWSFVFELISYLAIVAASSTALKVLSLLKYRGGNE